MQLYISDRYQVVHVAEVGWTRLPIDVGVPQEAILRPLLFLTFINNFQSELKLALAEII